MTEPTEQPAESTPTPGRFDVLLVLLLSVLVLVPRGWMISNAQSERWDDAYQLSRGLCFWEGSLGRVGGLNDPPLGQAIAAIPLKLMGCKAPTIEHGDILGNVLYDNPNYTAEQFLNAVAIWKSLLFAPFIVVAFIWARQLYGRAAGWLAAVVFLFEPMIAAHAPLPTMDAIAASAAVVAMYVTWRFLVKPSWPYLVGAVVIGAMAMTIKHTMLILPGVVGLLVFLFWVVRPRLAKPTTAPEPTEPAPPIPSTRRGVAFGVGYIALLPLAIWAFTLFNVDTIKTPGDHSTSTIVRKYGDWKVPARSYLASISDAMTHGKKGHVSYLFGEVRMEGWWYYFPVLAAYKMPIPIALMMIGALATLFVRRLRFDELALIVPGVCWALFVMKSPINTDWRHFFPAYFFMLLLATRVVTFGRGGTIAGFVLAAVMAVQALTFHPHYISYFNFPRFKPANDINNVDWGPNLVAIRAWLDHKTDDRSVYLAWRGGSSTKPEYYLGDRVHIVDLSKPPPQSGWLIINSSVEIGMAGDAYALLRPRVPDAYIADAMPVYDLDKLANGKPIPWGTPTTRPATDE